jgi:uracil-DNA glycosylase
MDIEKQLGEWYPLLSHVFDTEWMQKLGKRLGAAKSVTPSIDNLFRAFSLCPPSRVRVVIVGQDPYILGEADGLAFSSFGKMTPSLEVIFAEINRTHTCPRTVSWLDDWAAQGVLLINSVLTTELGKSKAHAGWGWELFTQEVLKVIGRLPQHTVVMAWGKDAQNIVNQFKVLAGSTHVIPEGTTSTSTELQPGQQVRGLQPFHRCQPVFDEAR